MSANLELVRSIYAAWERGDYSSAEWAHPDVEFVFADGPTPGTWIGLASAGEAWRDFLGVWKEWRVEVEEYLELDNERVLVLTRHSGRGKSSGLELSEVGAKGAGLYQVRGGRVIRNVFYFDRERALDELGLTASDHSEHP